MTDLAHWQLYITWIITALAGAFGIGVGWTVLKEQVKSQRAEFKSYTESAQREFITYKEAASVAATAAATAATAAANAQSLALKERLTRIEEKIDTQVGYPRCKDMRDECNTRIVSQLAEIVKQIQVNRETVLSQMKETEKFIGRVEQFMQRNGVGSTPPPPGWGTMK